MTTPGLRYLRWIHFPRIRRLTAMLDQHQSRMRAIGLNLQRVKCFRAKIAETLSDCSGREGELILLGGSVRGLMTSMTIRVLTV